MHASATDESGWSELKSDIGQKFCTKVYGNKWQPQPRLSKISIFCSVSKDSMQSINP